MLQYCRVIASAVFHIKVMAVHRQFLSEGDLCFYRSSSLGWVAARCNRVLAEGFVDLDCKEQVHPDSIYCLFEGTPVEYLSTSSDRWMPAEVVRKGRLHDTFDLTCKEAAEIVRMRPLTHGQPPRSQKLVAPIRDGEMVMDFARKRSEAQASARAELLHHSLNSDGDLEKLHTAILTATNVGVSGPELEEAAEALRLRAHAVDPGLLTRLLGPKPQLDAGLLTRLLGPRPTKDASLMTRILGPKPSEEAGLMTRLLGPEHIFTEVKEPSDLERALAARPHPSSGSRCVVPPEQRGQSWAQPQTRLLGSGQQNQSCCTQPQTRLQQDQGWTQPQTRLAGLEQQNQGWTQPQTRRPGSAQHDQYWTQPQTRLPGAAAGLWAPQPHEIGGADWKTLPHLEQPPYGRCVDYVVQPHLESLPFGAANSQTNQTQHQLHELLLRDAGENAIHGVSAPRMRMQQQPPPPDSDTRALHAQHLPFPQPSSGASSQFSEVHGHPMQPTFQQWPTPHAAAAVSPRHVGLPEHQQQFPFPHPQANVPMDCREMYEYQQQLASQQANGQFPGYGGTAQAMPDHQQQFPFPHASPHANSQFSGYGGVAQSMHPDMQQAYFPQPNPYHLGEQAMGLAPQQNSYLRNSVYG